MNMNKPHPIDITLRSEKSKVKTKRYGACDAYL